MSLKPSLKKRPTSSGAGPSLEKALKEFDFSDGTLIAADGATSALLENDLVPDIIVTDLDGRIPDLRIANDRGGSFMVVHAHGDNVDKMTSYVPLFSRVLGTTQTEPLDIVYNFGGFTDGGDRAAFLAEELGGLGRLCLLALTLGTLSEDGASRTSKSTPPQSGRARGKSSSSRRNSSSGWKKMEEPGWFICS